MPCRPASPGELQDEIFQGAGIPACLMTILGAMPKQNFRAGNAHPDAAIMLAAGMEWISTPFVLCLRLKRESSSPNPSWSQAVEQPRALLSTAIDNTKFLVQESFLLVNSARRAL